MSTDPSVYQGPVCASSIAISSGGRIKQHLEACRVTEPECMEEIERNLYVDDLISRGQISQEAQQIKANGIEKFSNTDFALHKWHLNAMELTSTVNPQVSWGDLRKATIRLSARGRMWQEIQNINLHS